jgi:hypothetical protein
MPSGFGWQVPVSSSQLALLQKSRSFVQSASIVQGPPPVGSAQAPTDATFTPIALAMQSYGYVVPLQPHTSSPGGMQ